MAEGPFNGADNLLECGRVCGDGQSAEKFGRLLIGQVETAASFAGNICGDDARDFFSVRLNSDCDWSAAKQANVIGDDLHGWSVLAVSKASADFLECEVPVPLMMVKWSSFQSVDEGAMLSLSPIGVLGGVLKGLWPTSDTVTLALESKSVPLMAAVTS